jgi:hypothetical protein
VPQSPPPARYDGTPNRMLLRRGTCLWRVHRREHTAWTFNTLLSDQLFGGGRFDATGADPYPYWYAALDEATALAETLLRDLHPDETGTRVLTDDAVLDRRISGLALTRNLELVSLLGGRDLGAIGQDHWLVTASGHRYTQTRGWAHWLRSKAEWAHGIIWPSLRDLGNTAIVLFGDRCAAAFGSDYERLLLHEIPELAVDLDDAAGVEWLNSMLEPYRVAVACPECRNLSKA